MRVSVTVLRALELGFRSGKRPRTFRSARHAPRNPSSSESSTFPRQSKRTSARHRRAMGVRVETSVRRCRQPRERSSSSLCYVSRCVGDARATECSTQESTRRRQPARRPDRECESSISHGWCADYFECLLRHDSRLYPSRERCATLREEFDHHGQARLSPNAFE